MISTCFFDLFSGEIISWEDLVDKISKSRVIYVGEIHDKKVIHEIQLKIIRALVERGHKVAIAFEMFQQPYQKYLDGFVGGEISEVEMLYHTGWHKNWGMDVGLYRDIWNYAREKKLKILAINIPTEFREKVRRMSYNDMRKSRYLPDDLKEPDSAYISYFKSVMGGHEGVSRRFDEMLKVMLAWDEGMAYSIAKFLKENPDYRVVVVVGYGHVYGRLGIPKRVERMTGERGVVIIPINNIKEDLKGGDYGYVLPETF